MASESVNLQVLDNVPKRIKELKFGIAAAQEFVKQGVVEVCRREIYDIGPHRAAAHHGPLDIRLGLSDKSNQCGTCGESLQTCMGHFGYVKLALPVLHIGYFKFVVHILQIICKECSSILLPEDVRRAFWRDLRRPNIDNLRKTQICQKVSKEAKKVHVCPTCGSLNGRVKKNGTGPLKVTHERFSHHESSKAQNKKPLEAKVNFMQSFEKAKLMMGDIEKNTKKALDDLNPLRILRLFEKISAPNCELLGMNPVEGRPEMFIWRYLPVAPNCIRPSVQQESSTTEDDITSKIADICFTNAMIRKALDRGERIGTLMEQWDFLQSQVAMLINSEGPGLTTPGSYVTMRGFCQRLKGKQGRFRGNLSGKRVDFSGRTVISPDPNLAVDEVAIPEHVAKTMTYPERVTQYNIGRMREAVHNGQRLWPGANQVIKANTGMKQSTKYGSQRQAETLAVNDIVERHLRDGDVVLFNRQPSLHKLSIMAHRVRVRASRTFRLNECVCTPYNADFDGDEMNLHVPQTEEAKAEALELMGVRHNLVTPRNGEPIIAAIQDFITGAYLLSNKDNFFDRKSFNQLCLSMVEGREPISLPPPTIVKPVQLWTGKQVFSVLIRPTRFCDVRINVEAAGKEYRPNPKSKFPRHFDEKDSWLSIQDSEVLCGVMDKATIGAGKKESVFFTILRDFGEDAALEAMNRLARLIPRFLTRQGFSIGIGDVRASRSLTVDKETLVELAYGECDGLIASLKNGTLLPSGAYNEEQTLEKAISSKLTNVRGQAGERCSEGLSKHNAALIMADCGSKGTSVNVSQMVAVVGQQIINQERVEDGFQDRTLPHFPRNSRQPPSKGFVRNSFYSGLNPNELFFHAMSGREGLVDTAVKTAETGYMSRRLMKSLEDLSTQYDQTVRNSSGAVVQFKYGDDRLDPTTMEGQAKPVNLDHAFYHVQVQTCNNKEEILTASQALSFGQQILQEPQAILDQVMSSTGTQSQISTIARTLKHEASVEDFVNSVATYIIAQSDKAVISKSGAKGKQHEITVSREKLGPNEGPETKDSRVGHVMWTVTEATLHQFLALCLKKYEKAIVQPGTAVGAIGAQSIGEPGTQMTLKTFHSAGLGNLQITQGVPRMKEIINASREISTPIITCQLNTSDSVEAARIVKGRIEQTFLRDVINRMDQLWSKASAYLELELDVQTISKLELEVTPPLVRDCILATRRLRLHPQDVRIRHNLVRVEVRPYSHARGDSRAKKKVQDSTETFARALFLKRNIPDVPICGFAGASRAVIKSEKDHNCLLVQGYGLRNCMITDGVKDTTTTTNSITEARDVLGIEAARSTIIREISEVMQDMAIDPRHMQLLGDVMTYRGEVLGITRFGLSKMRDSVLQLASFEKTPDHLFEAAWHAKRDRIEGVSECIIMGQSISQGTGAFQIVKPLSIPTTFLGKKKTIFEDVWLDVESPLA